MNPNSQNEQKDPSTYYEYRRMFLRAGVFVVGLILVLNAIL